MNKTRSLSAEVDWRAAAETAQTVLRDQEERIRTTQQALMVAERGGATVMSIEKVRELLAGVKL